MDNRESEILPANIPDVAHDDDDAPDVGLSTDVIVNDHNPLQEESDLPLDDPRPSRVFYEHHMIGIAKQWNITNVLVQVPGILLINRSPTWISIQTTQLKERSVCIVSMPLACDMNLSGEEPPVTMAHDVKTAAVGNLGE
jgi:hypothetical protein